MDTRHVTARIARAEPMSASVRLHLHEEAPGHATAVATDNGHVLLQYYFARSGRTIVLESDGRNREARISGTLWKPRGRLWLLDLDQAAS